jgi:hypothetical protein
MSPYRSTNKIFAIICVPTCVHNMYVYNTNRRKIKNKRLICGFCKICLEKYIISRTQVLKSDSSK